MKKNKQKADTKQSRVPQFGRLTLLVGALVATGVLPPLSLPEAWLRRCLCRVADCLAVAAPRHSRPVSSSNRYAGNDEP